MKRDPAVVIRESLDEVLAFLGDRAPPALVVESISILVGIEPEVLASELRGWSYSEQRTRKDVTVSDLLEHALRKLQVFEELNILPADGYRRYLDRVTALVVSAVPGEEREGFVQKIVDLRGFDPEEVASTMMQKGDGAPGGPKDSSAGGVDPWSTTGVFRALANEVPDWAVAGEDGLATPGGAPLEAMYRMVSLEPSRDRSGKRWEQMLRTAAEHFNHGALARSVTLLELAARMVQDGEIEEETALKIRERAGRWFSADRLLEETRSSARRPLLRKLLEFLPTYSPHRLIDQLAAETDRHRRRYLLMLLETLGPASREVVVQRLETTLLAPARDTESWYLQRNLLYLLNRLPRPADADLAWELRLVSVLSRVNLPVPLVREAVLFAGRIPHPGAATLLVDRMREVEKLLVDGVTDVHPVPQLWRLANSLATALARVGTTEARLALVEHALSFHPRLGDTSARLADLAGEDLSAQPEVVEALLDSLRQLAPMRVLGVTVARNETALTGIVRALVATRTPEVRKALEQVAERYSDREFGAIARKATHPEIELAPAKTATPSDDEVKDSALTGDLGVFGLPQLVQSMEQSHATGQLRLRGENGSVYAVFRFVAGKLAECVAGGLRGKDAFFQAFQHPSAGTFEFLRDKSVPTGQEDTVFPLLMEAIRRYDEFQSTRAVVPDGAFVRVAQRKPTTPEDEDDGELVRTIWERVRGGTTVTECELAAKKDSFRIRRLLAHWVSEGAAEVMTGREGGRAESGRPPSPGSGRGRKPPGTS